MANFDFDVVVKIGSMALIRKEDNDLDYNIFNRLASELKPGYILVSSGATEIGRIDYMKRNGGMELRGDMEEINGANTEKPYSREWGVVFIHSKIFTVAKTTGLQAFLAFEIQQ